MKQFRRGRWLLGIALFAISVMPVGDAKQTHNLYHKVVIFTLPEIDPSVISDDFPYLNQLVSSSSVGLVKVPDKLNRLNGSLFNNIIHDAIQVENPARLVMKGSSFTKPDTGILLLNTLVNVKNSKISLSTYDYWLGRVLRETDFETTLMIVCFSNFTKHRKEDRTLIPVFLKGKTFPNGVLYSPRTRRTGIITYHDVKNIILAASNPNINYNAALRIKPGNWRNLLQERNILIKNYLLRWPILTGYVYLMLGIILLWIYAIIFGHYRIIKALTLGYIYFNTLPAVFLIEAIFDPVEWVTISMWTFVISGVFFFTAYFISHKNMELMLTWITSITVVLVLINSAFNGFYESRSFLGYSVVAGGRYYGTGNEYMGILLGAYITGVSLTIGRWKWSRLLLWIASFGIGLILIHPRMGADVGGGLTALLGLGITNYLWLNQRIGFRQIFYLTALTGAALALAGWFDIYTGREEMSHWGQLWLAVGNEGVQPFIQIVGRKLAMNYRLIRSTPMTLVLLLFILAIPILLFHPPSRLKQVAASHGKIVPGLMGICVTALIGFITNDSGIASAAMIFMFGLGMVFLVVYEEIAKSEVSVK